MMKRMVQRSRWCSLQKCGVVALLVVVAAALVGCGDGDRGRAAKRTSVPPGTEVVALGDSVPAGTACDCVPYPALVATDLSTRTTKVTSHNEAVAGYTTDDVIKQLTDDARVIEEVRTAIAVTVEVGANDVAHSSACGDDSTCYLEELPHTRANLEAIVARVRELTANDTTPVVLLDYWSVWLGGRYADEQGAAYVEAADAVTNDVNDTIHAVATSHHCIYVSLVRAFRGPRESRDETRLLASDGEHPNARGHHRIADAVAVTVRRR